MIIQLRVLLGKILDLHYCDRIGLAGTMITRACLKTRSELRFDTEGVCDALMQLCPSFQKVVPQIEVLIIARGP